MQAHARVQAMKPRHVRRLVVALVACGALLLLASFVLGMLDDGVLQGDVKDKKDDALPSAQPGPDDPGGFHRFQAALVRRKAEERERDQQDSAEAEDAVSVSEKEAASIIVSARMAHGTGGLSPGRPGRRRHGFLGSFAARRESLERAPAAEGAGGVRAPQPGAVPLLGRRAGLQAAAHAAVRRLLLRQVHDAADTHPVRGPS